MVIHILADDYYRQSSPSWQFVGHFNCFSCLNLRGLIQEIYYTTKFGDKSKHFFFFFFFWYPLFVWDKSYTVCTLVTRICISEFSAGKTFVQLLEKTSIFGKDFFVLALIQCYQILAISLLCIEFKNNVVS